MKIVESRDLLPKLKDEIIYISEEEIKNLVFSSIDGEEINEVSFIPKVNIIFVIYGGYKKSRIIYVIKESLNLESIGNLTLDNLDSFSIDNFSFKELRNEDFDTVSEGVETLSRIVIDNNKGE
jgi:hypothetical protein